eukprot:14330249-Alexandrium_andersonii.AAC.1
MHACKSALPASPTSDKQPEDTQVAVKWHCRARAGRTTSILHTHANTLAHFLHCSTYGAWSAAN